MQLHSCQTDQSTGRGQKQLVRLSGNYSPHFEWEKFKALNSLDKDKCKDKSERAAATTLLTLNGKPTR